VAQVAVVASPVAVVSQVEVAAVEDSPAAEAAVVAVAEL